MKRQNNFKTSPNMAIPTQRPQNPVQIAPMVKEPSMKLAALSALGEAISRKAIAISCFLIGAVFGLTVLGWGLWPVEYTGATYEHLSTADKALIVEMASDLNAYDPTTPAVIELRQRWGELDGVACFIAKNESVTEAEQARLKFMALRINNTGCE